MYKGLVLFLLLLIFTIPLLLLFLLRDEKFDQKRHVRKLRSENLRNYVNTKISPCNDFYEFSCGNWEKLNPLPDGQQINDEKSIMRNTIVTRIRKLLEEPVNRKWEWKAMQKTKQFYSSCMDTYTIKKRGIKPILNVFHNLGGFPALESTTSNSWDSANKFNLSDLLIKMKNFYNFNIFFTIEPYYEAEKNNGNTVIISPLPSFLRKQDYFNSSKQSIVHEYTKFIEGILQGLEVQNSSVIADEFISFEAKVIPEIPENELETISDLIKNKEAITYVANFDYRFPQLKWREFIAAMTGLNITHETKIILRNRKYLQNFFKTLNKTPQRMIANYALLKLMHEFIFFVDDRFTDAFNKFVTIMRRGQNSEGGQSSGDGGIHIPTSRWNFCVILTRTEFPSVINALYLKKYYDFASVPYVTNLIEKIRKEFVKLINRPTNWLNFEMKENITNRLDSMNFTVGYTEDMLSEMTLNERYSSVNIDPYQFFENCLNFFKRSYEINYDRNDLLNIDTTALDINYLLNEEANRLFIPAGLLQPPIFSVYLPNSTNYGQLGSLIGTELAKIVFNNNDNTNNNEDIENNQIELRKFLNQYDLEIFNNKIKCFLLQYSSYKYDKVNNKSEQNEIRNNENGNSNNSSNNNDNNVEISDLDGFNGKLTNTIISDQIGLFLAYAAYENLVREDNLNRNSTNFYNIREEMLPNFKYKNFELFFISYTQNFCNAQSVESKNQYKMNNKILQKFRLMNTLQNFDQFSRIFSCGVERKMNVQHKCKFL